MKIYNFNEFKLNENQELIDSILDKIGKEGISSLSNYEKNILDNYSKGVDINEMPDMKYSVMEFLDVLYGDLKMDTNWNIDSDSDPDKYYFVDSDGILKIELVLRDGYKNALFIIDRDYEEISDMFGTEEPDDLIPFFKKWLPRKTNSNFLEDFLKDFKIDLIYTNWD